MRIWYHIAKFLWRFEAFQDAVEDVLDERLWRQCFPPAHNDGVPPVRVVHNLVRTR